MFSVPPTRFGTSLQKRGWGSLANVPYGTTGTYAQRANMLGPPKSVRAVARANGAKTAILIPCHRIAGADGVERKKSLLELTGRMYPALRPRARRRSRL